MFRRYAWAALALAAAACGDSGGGGGGDSTKDAGSTTDAAVTVPVVVGKSTETGKACAADSDCGGKGSDCLTSQTLQTGGSITFEGGYCSALCTDDTECNAEGKTEAGCPAGVAIKNLSATLGGASGLISGFLSGIATCLVKCSTEADCRGTGYKCQSLSDAVKGNLPAGTEQIAGALSGFLGAGTYCISTQLTLPEGGLGGGDAGTSDAGTSDAGSSDAGSSDAGSSDAGTTSDAGDAG